MPFDVEASILNVTAIRRDLDPLHCQSPQDQTRYGVAARIQDAIRDVGTNCHSTYSPGERHEYCERLGKAVTELQEANVEGQIRRCALKCRYILGCLLRYLDCVRQRDVGARQPDRTMMIQSVLD